MLFVASSFFAYAQDNQLYGANYLPQSLMLNPSSEVTFDSHIGIPLFSGFKLEASSKVSVYDIFANDSGQDINQQITLLIPKLSYKDFASVNQKLEGLSFGWRNKHKNYLSVGWYEELDFITYLPKDIINLLHDGNVPNINHYFFTNGVAARADALSVFHFGMNTKYSRKLNLGVRFKYYSSIANASSLKNSGYFITKETGLGSNIYDQRIENVNLLAKTSGIEAIENADIKQLVKRVFFGGNAGVGIDLGFTYKLNHRTILSGSLIDLGIISHQYDIKDFYLEGSYQYDGIEFSLDRDLQISYTRDIQDEFENAFDYGNRKGLSYTTYMPAKGFLSLAYKFGESDNCNCLWPDERIYRNKIGLLLRAIKRPLTTQIATTVYYEATLLPDIFGKVTYTVDSYSFYNLGMLFSYRWNKFNIYLSLNNIIGYTNLAKAKTAGFQLGAQFLINKN